MSWIPSGSNVICVDEYLYPMQADAKSADEKTDAFVTLGSPESPVRKENIAERPDLEPQHLAPASRQSLPGLYGPSLCWSPVKRHIVGSYPFPAFPLWVCYFASGKASVSSIAHWYVIPFPCPTSPPSQLSLLCLPTTSHAHFQDFPLVAQPRPRL